MFHFSSYVRNGPGVSQKNLLKNLLLKHLHLCFTTLCSLDHYVSVTKEEKKD